MSEFFTYCDTATDNCDYTAYNSSYFDGWSIGSYIALSTYSDAAQIGYLIGMCFEETFSCLGFALDDTVGSEGDIDYAWNGVFN